MIFRKIPLAEGENGADVRLDAYLADPVHDYTRRAMLVIPGGGYGAVCSDREGEPIAMAFLAQGYNAFVLHYTVGRKKPYPKQLQEASLAAAHIRRHAAEYGIDPGKLFAVGFSAGGHLAGSLGTMWHRDEAWKDLGLAYGENRPDGVMLIYPVVSAVEDYSNWGTIFNLWCTDTPTEEQKKLVSLELAVDERSAPLFVAHTSNDQSVDVRNSLVLAAAYRAHGLPFEMHIYPDAPHGVALGNDITRCGVAKWSNPRIARWTEDAAMWAQEL